jgi:hypothetical protein
MTGKAKQALLIVITRIHTPKGDENDEYVTYWEGKLNKAGELDTNFLDVCDFLLVHGHSNMQNDIKSAIDNVLKENKFKLSNWKQVYCFVHARKEYRKKIKEISDIGNHVYGYGSRGTNLASQDLLEQIELKIKDGFLSDYRDQILYKIKEKLRGFRYKQHLLNQVKELLLQLRFNLEVFACESGDTFEREASEDIKSIVEDIRKNLNDPPLLLCIHDKAGTPKMHNMFQGLDPFEKLIAIFATDLADDEPLCAKKVWNFIFSAGPSSETLNLSKEARNELEQIPKDFENLSKSIEAVLNWIKSNSAQGTQVSGSERIEE